MKSAFSSMLLLSSVDPICYIKLKISVQDLWRLPEFMMGFPFLCVTTFPCSPITHCTYKWKEGSLLYKLLLNPLQIKTILLNTCNLFCPTLRSQWLTFLLSQGLPFWKHSPVFRPPLNVCLPSCSSPGSNKQLLFAVGQAPGLTFQHILLPAKGVWEEKVTELRLLFSISETLKVASEILRQSGWLWKDFLKEEGGSVRKNHSHQV